MKNILLLIHDDPGEEARLQAAFDLTRAVSGHVTCLDIMQVPILIGADYMMADAALALHSEARERQAANRARTKARIVREDVAWNWINATGDIAPLLTNQSALADIIILNTAFADRRLPDMRAIISEVVMDAGKPILAVPEACRGLETQGHALIAWNGAPVLLDTLRAVTPLLALAQAVTILEIGVTDGAPAEEGAAYLSRYGIHARIDRDDPSDRWIGEALLAACRDRRPAYCVMGAYGHSPLLEALLGGVTREMLAHSPVPLILGQ